MPRQPKRTSKPKWLTELAGFSVTKPSQLVEKSNQWFDDTNFLFDEHRRAAAVYLGGFVIECLLKAMLFARRSEERIARLLNGSHDLAKLLAASSGLERELASPVNRNVRDGFELLQSWSVRIRYNPKRPSAEDANHYRQRPKQVREWLIGKI